MSAKVKAEPERGGARSIKHQPNRFAGLFLAPIVGLLATWLIHVWTRGVDVHAGPIDWVVPASNAATMVVVSLATAATIGLSVLAWKFTAHRELSKQISLTGSVSVLGALFAISIGVGPQWWWSGAFVLCGWTVAVVWSMVRLDVARRDARGDEPEEDSLMKQLGISKRTKFKSRVVHDDDGNPARIEMDVRHAPGETVKVIQDGIEAIESTAAGPPGMSTATGDPERADRSQVSVMLTDPFRRNIRVGPLTSPGGSIADLASVADYADGKPGFVTIAAGKHMATSTSYGLIGMTRAGKTGTETQLLTEWGSRCDWACLYLNQAKGLQDIRPLLPIIEAAVIAEDGDQGLGDYVLAFSQIRAIMAYRQQELGRFAVSAWSPRCCDPNPDRRPTAIIGGRRVPMEPMPFLTCHVGEADAILNSGRASEDAVFIASKGLSLGVNSGWSLQRPDWKAMPTGLRANIGLWFAHGMNGSDDEDFVVPDWVQKAGANPARWGQRKPGQHYMFGPGIDEARFPVALKTRFLVGSETDETTGRPLDFDTLNDRYMAEMLRRNLASAPGMAALDAGSAEATGGWWAEQVAKTVDLRARMLADAPANTPQTAPRKPRIFAGAAVPQVAGEEEIDPAELAELADEFDEDAANTTEIEGINVFGEDAAEEAATRAVDLTVPFHPPAGDDGTDPLADAEEDDKPEAMTREEARAELRRTVAAMIADPKYADPKVPGTAVITPGDVFERCRFRSRPWVSAELATMLIDGGGITDGVLLERDGNPRKGRYRARRTAGSDHQQ